MLLSPLWLAVTFLHAAAGVTRSALLSAGASGNGKTEVDLEHGPREGKGVEVQRQGRGGEMEENKEAEDQGMVSSDTEMHALLCTCVCMDTNAHIEPAWGLGLEV